MHDSQFQISLLFWPADRDERPRVLGHTWDHELTARARQLIASELECELRVLNGEDDSSTEEQAIEL